ncbi:complement receptor type 1-like isoform X2 [Genypterus blacodes]|uniref:complement receptor type 1-like isoform X2 n=1 Tax=Genypterus blacodes TaxID=154954 RepID=UPI003F7623C2
MCVITQSCVVFLWMHALAFVRSQDCTLAQFKSSRLYDSNFDTTGLEPTYRSDKQVRVSCITGFTGFFKLTCTAGEWHSTGSKCEARSCGHPGDVDNAEFHLKVGDDYVFGSEVEYTCNPGYHMVSRTSVRRCMSQGWDNRLPTCEAIRCPNIPVDENVSVIGDPEEAAYGNLLAFSCKSRSEMLDGPTMIRCDENGQWTGQAPKCIEIKCQVPGIENGHMIGHKQIYDEQEVLHFDCNSKYKRTDDKPARCEKTGNKAEFIPTPECQPIQCSLTLTTIGGIVYEPAARNVFLPEETLKVTCDDRHWVFNKLQTSHVFTCRDDGTWMRPPVCNEIICSNPGGQGLNYWYVRNWQQKKLDDTNNYSCREGYKKTAAWATCTRGGWSPNPLCEAITCDRSDVKNAEITANDKDTYSYNDQVRYSCKAGFTGQFTLTCKERGWEGNPRCEEKLCGKIDIADAQTSATKWRFRHNEGVQYYCTNYPERRFTITCGPSGWTGTQSCTDCQRPPIQNGFAVGPYNGAVFYTCNEGFKFSTKGWWQETKCNKGRWDPLEPCIGSRTCGKIPEIPNAEPPRSTRDYIHGQSVQIRCKHGYRANVNSMRCQEGEWHFNELSLDMICTPTANPCSPPPKLENAVAMTPYQREYLSGSAVTYRCQDQYRMDGDDRITCTDGTWEMNGLVCTSMTCDRSDVKNAEITANDKDTYSYNEQVRYSCKAGFTGQFTLTCKGRGWEGNPLCEEKLCEKIDIADAQTSDRRWFRHNEGVEYVCTNYPERRFTITCGPSGWTGTQNCTAITCDRSDVKNAEIIANDKDTYSYNDQVSYSCKAGFTGQFTLTCKGRSWEGNPHCEEKLCEKIDIADAQTSDWRGWFRLNEGVEYVCTNYPERRFTITCGPSGWTGTQNCTAITCDRSDVKNAEITANDKDTYSYNDQVRYSCKAGFTGQFTLTCKGRGWEGNPHCEAIQCSLTLTTIGGIVYEPAARNVFLPEETLKVTCDDRHWVFNKLQTSHVFTCRDDGTWMRPPVCNEIICSNPGEQGLNYWYVRHWQQKKLDDTKDYSCREGYKKTAARATCTRGGWSPNPLCEAITCDRSDVKNAEITANDKDTYSYNDQVRYSCKAGFTGQFTLTCKGRGWEGNPHCEAIQCSLTLTTIGGIVYEPAARNVFLPEETLKVTCDDRHWVFNKLQTSHVFTCRDDGTWMRPPVCNEIICSNPGEQGLNYWYVRHWQQKKLDDTKDYSCREGYKKTAARATCTRGGWSPNPLCEAITCDRSDVKNAEITANDKDTYSYNDQVRYSCKAGFTGQFTLTCKGRGWEGNPRCEEKLCGKIDIAESQTSDRRRWFRHNEGVQYYCTNYPERRFTITCGPSGWTGTQSCTDCQRPPIQNGFAVGPYNGAVFYTCNEGFKFSTKGWWQETKCNKGRWDPLEPCIGSRTCGKIPEIPNAEPPRSTRDYIHGQSVQIRCKHGYRANVNSMRCQEGEWHFNELSLDMICTPTANPCSPPPKLENAVAMTPYQREYLSGSAVTYRCQDQYRMDGDERITCTNGTWEMNGLACTSITCDRSDVKNAEITANDKDTYSYNDQVSYSCKAGFTGQFTLTCKERGWEGDSHCEEKLCEKIDIADAHTSDWRGWLRHNEGVEYVCTNYPERRFTITCGPSGWTGTQNCTAITCDRSDVKNAEITANDKDTYSYNDQVSYSCKAGFTGQFTLTCKERGWEGNPHCEEKLCGKIDIAETQTSDRRRWFRHNEGVQYYCTNYPERRFMITCGPSGWTGTQNCTAITCDRSDVKNAEITANDKDTYSYNDQVSYSCKAGFTGQFTLTCKERGWEGNPHCEEKLCGKIDIAETQTSDRRRWFRHNEGVQYYCTNYPERRFMITCGPSGWTGTQSCTAITCDRSDVKNAEITANDKDTYSYNDQVSYSCKAGFTGQFTLTCKERGWEGNPHCEEKLCEKIDIADAHTSDWRGWLRHNEGVEYVCTNYPERRFTITCGPSGWTGTQNCTAITCDRSDVKNAEITANDKDTYSYNDQVSYSCKAGFTGQFTLTCKERGWEGNPHCEEKLCEKIDIADAHTSDWRGWLRHNEGVEYVCTNYPERRFTITCGPSGWTGTQNCTAITCDRSDVKNAEITANDKDTYSYNDQVSYSCKAGFTGQFTLTCKERGWEGNPHCEEKLCEKIDIADAHTSDWRGWLRHNEGVEYVCTNYPERRFTITCGPSGWTGTQNCTAITCDRSDVKNAEITANDKDTYSYNDQVSYSCKAGFTGQFTLTCKERGWEGNPHCEEKLCEKIDIADAHTSDWRGWLRHNEGVEYVCTNYPERRFTITCGPSGWTGTQNCTAITCDRSDVKNAEITANDKDTYSYNDQVSYSCKAGFTGQFTLTCKERGWEGNPHCEEKLCEKIDIADAHTSDWRGWLRHNEGVEYVCTNYPERRFTITCGPSGWTGTQNCTAITCDRSDVKNAEITANDKDTYSYNDQVSYSCKAGFTGQFTLTCKERGWEGNPHCEEKLCEKIDIADAHTSDWRGWLRHNEGVEYVCTNYPERRFTITCGPSGWTGTQNCTAITCDRSDVKNAEITANDKDTYSYNDQVSYSCKAGFTGQFTLTCKERGWEGNPHCEEKLCGKIDIAETQTSDRRRWFRHNEGVQYYCTNYPERRFMITCGPSGWTGTQNCTGESIINTV